MEAQARLRISKNVSKHSASAENINSSYAGYNSNEGDNIKVYVRIRPPHQQILEGNVDNSICLEVTSPESLTIATKPEPKQFSYDHVAHMETTQEEVFATVGKGIIEAFVNGFNGTIFAYGQTGSGKTFTMLGPADDTDNFTHELRGVIPRGFEYLFSLINRQQEKAGDRVEFLARCSFLEIYNEQVFDLLEPSTASLHLRENIKKGVFVEGLAERDVSSAKDAYSVLQAGWLNRRVASTSMNRESSRSHAVFTVSLESKKRTGGMANIKVSKLHLVDLAGSERQKDTHTQDVRLKEAGSINKSLSALGNVIMALVDIAHGKTRHIHYRDSKLTFILRDSLGGNAKTYIIANVHPSSRCFGETLSTLNFARRAKMIKNKAVVNEDITGNVSELQAEIRKLKELLAQNKVEVIKEHKTSDVTSPAQSKSSSHDGSQWKELMINAIAAHDQAEEEKMALQEKVVKLEELCGKKEKFLQSTRMILKFRTEHIVKLEGMLKKELGPQEEDSKDKEIKLLKEEIKVLQSSIDHHPEVKRFAMENLELRAEIKRLKALDPSNGDFTKTMAEKHRYTLQLERQLHELMTSQSNDLEKSLSSSQQSLEASNAEIEKIKIELAQVQAKLDISQNEVKQCRKSLQEASEETISMRENSRKKELELQSDLAAIRKCNNELERALEALQLKTAVERTAMNSLHIQTIKTLSSPRKFGTPKSTPRKNESILSSKQSTPINKCNLNGSVDKNKHAKENDKNKSLNEEYVNDPNRRLEDEPPPKIMQRKDSLNDVSDDEDDVNPFWDFTNETRDDEVIYIEALQDEIKQLQDLYSQSIQTLHDEQRKKIPLTEMIAKLDHKVKDLEQLLISERQNWSIKESELTTQLTTLRDKYKETQGSATILKSEVDDLRILLTSADKQLDLLKKEKKEEIIEAGRKYAAIESKYVKLEIDFFNLQTEMDTTAESNNNLQSDFEQCKEELEFSQHKNCELEEIVAIERKKVKEGEEKLQIALEKLNYELETKIKLTQEDKQEELIKSMETINSLREELSFLTRKAEEQDEKIIKLSSDLDRSRSEVATQKWVNITDKEAINKFMKGAQELRDVILKKDGIISSLQSELEDLKQQQQSLQEAYDEKKKKIQKLNEALKVESDKLVKEKEDREKEVITLQDEIQILQDQCREVTLTLQEERQQLQVLQSEHLELKVTLAQKISTITGLEDKLTEGNINTSSVFVGQEKHMEAKAQLVELARLSEHWESSKLNDKTNLEEMKRRCSEFEIIESGKEMLEGRVEMLELELEDIESERKEWLEREAVLQKEVATYKKAKERSEVALKEVTEKKQLAENATLESRQQLAALEMNLCNVQDDLEANLEELEKTKELEEKYFEEKTNLQSKLAVVVEEKTRFEQQITQLLKDKESLELEKSKHFGHHNHNQRIEHLMSIKKENLALREQVNKFVALCSCGGKSKT
ncbi:kinesin-like protein KIF15 isoform X3 [Hydractinia symbiolongicarpus]|uniref:kinesin-like protein KIF15 isoform X3 n=1 Tax=Hydractinia symbiolongicarpus TaxID=13093 RepID=UPI00254E3C66|nr:kinesin-like protein KIF15 isoform X3 [Hydractinia symbiolongicarpus]